MPESLRVLVVDDEPPARENLRVLVDRWEGLEWVGECSDGRAAVASILNSQVDLVLLDIQMPGLDGFGVVREVGAANMPDVVFVTAFDQYALKAFEVSAVDYLLKPFHDERFAAAMERAQIRHASVGTERLAVRLAKVLVELDDLRAGVAARSLDRIPVAKPGRVELIDPRHIDRVEAADDYVRIHAGGATHLLRMTMNEMERRLDPGQFVRVHRSHIANIDRIKALVPQNRGDLIVVLRDGTRMRLSRSRRKDLEVRLGMSL